MWRAVIVGNGDVQQLFKFLQRNQLFDRHSLAFLADRVVRITSRRAVHPAGHTVGQRQEEAFDTRTRRRFAHRAGFHTTAHELAYGSKGIFGQV